MRASSSESETSDGQEGTGSIYIYLGIGLFIFGFLLTVMSSSGSLTVTESASGDHVAADSGTSPGFDGAIAFLGIFIGLLGVVTATVGPLTTVVKTTKQR